MEIPSLIIDPSGTGFFFELPLPVVVVFVFEAQAPSSINMSSIAISEWGAIPVFAVIKNCKDRSRDA